MIFNIQGRNKNRRTQVHDAQIKAIEALGFKVLDLRGVVDGKFADRRYHLLGPDGVLYDNPGGDGYRSSLDALREAEEIKKKLDEASGK